MGLLARAGPLLRYTIREHLERIGDPAVTTHPFSARYAYHPNGTVWEAEFYNAGSPATAKRYRYVFPTTSYDALNRLKSADFSSWSGSSWTSTLAHDLTTITYDVAGNLRSLRRYRQDATLIDRLGYFYPGSSNRLSSVSDTVGTTSETWDAESGSFTYDANGNLKTAPAPYSITAVTYDHQNLALSLTSAGTTKTYRYNEAGQRITKQVGTGNTEVYLLDGMTALGVFTVNGTGSVVASYFNVLAGDKVVGRQPSTGNRRYYHTDLLGSTRAVVEGATVVESFDFDPWGLLMPGRTLAGPTKEGFTSKERDAESGLDYFGARYYMPALARWTSVDPLADSMPQWTPYNYVYNNPLMFTDRYGLEPDTIKVQWHQVFREHNHASIKITPNNQEKWKDHPEFERGSDGRVSITLGAEPRACFPSGSCLVSDFNRPTDVEPQDGEMVIDIGQRNEDDVISSLMRTDAKYNDNLPYGPLPGKGDNTYNSNSYPSGILAYAGLFVSAPAGVSLPGWDKPIPINPLPQPVRSPVTPRRP